MLARGRLYDKRRIAFALFADSPDCDGWKAHKHLLGLIIERVIAEAVFVAPCLADPHLLPHHKLVLAREVIENAVIRRFQRETLLAGGDGRQASAETVGEFSVTWGGHTLGRAQSGHAFTSGETARLRALCGISGGAETLSLLGDTPVMMGGRSCGI